LFDVRVVRVLETLAQLSRTLAEQIPNRFAAAPTTSGRCLNGFYSDIYGAAGCAAQSPGFTL